MAWDDKEEPLQQTVFGGVLGDLLDRSRLHSAEEGCGPVWGGEYAPDDAVDAVRAAIPQAQISPPVTATLAAGVVAVEVGEELAHLVLATQDLVGWDALLGLVVHAQDFLERFHGGVLDQIAIELGVYRLWGSS